MLMEKPNSELGQGTDDMFSRLLNQGSNHEILKSLTGYVEPSFRTHIFENFFLNALNFKPTFHELCGVCGHGRRLRTKAR